MRYELSPNYVPLSPLPPKVEGHVPQLLWERRPCGLWIVFDLDQRDGRLNVFIMYSVGLICHFISFSVTLLPLCCLSANDCPVYVSVSIYRDDVTARRRGGRGPDDVTRHVARHHQSV